MKIAIAGAGKLGLKVARALLSGDHAVTLIDKNADVLDKLSTQLDVRTINANAKESSILNDIHISSFDYLVACTDRDEKNIVIAQFAKKLGCRRVIARVRDPEHVNQFDFIKECTGIDYLVNPDMAVTKEIFNYLVENITPQNGILSTGNATMLNFEADNIPELLDKPIKDIGAYIPGMLVGAISRRGKVIVPNGDTIINSEDYLYVIGKKDELAELGKDMEFEEEEDIQKVMILGGGKTGYFLAKELSEYGMSVKIVERDRNRCYYLAEHLDKAMVLQGDATDIALLHDENIDNMDALITSTGFDEDNLLMALMGKKSGIQEVVAKVSRDTYTSMLSDMGVDMALNPQNITVSEIIRTISGSKKVIAYKMIQGQAEILEIRIDDDMRIEDETIKDLNLPKGVLIGQVQRGDEIFIPNGNTVLMSGDRATIFCMLTEVQNIESLLTTSNGINIL